MVILTIALTLLAVISQAEEVVSLNLHSLLSYASAADGVTVFHLPKGRYAVSETLNLPSNSVLEGEGRDTLLVATSPFHGHRFITNSRPRIGNNNIKLRDFRVEYFLPESGMESPGVLRFDNVDGLDIVGIDLEMKSGYFGIDLSSSVRHCTVRECSIVNAGRGGCVMVRNQNPAPDRPSFDISLVDNELVSFTQDEPVAIFGWLGKVENIFVGNNRITAEGASFGITVYGIDRGGHTGEVAKVRVVENRVKGGAVGGIAVKGGAIDVEVTANRVDDTGGDGIFLHSGGEKLPPVRKVSVARNEVLNAGRHCVFATGDEIRIEDNFLHDCRAMGIYVNGTIDVIGNRIENSAPGIFIDSSADVRIEKNDLRRSAGINGVIEGQKIIGNIIVE